MSNEITVLDHEIVVVGEDVLPGKDRALIEYHCNVSLAYTYMVFGVKFTDCMGERYSLTMFNNCQTANTFSGHNKFGYIVKMNERVIFHGYDLGIPDMPSEPQHFIQIIESLLGFVSLGEGDTDNEYFDSYTNRQIEWRDAHAEDLSLFAYDLYEFLYDDDLDHAPQFDSLFLVEQGYLITHVTGLVALDSLSQLSL